MILSWFKLWETLSILTGHGPMDDNYNRGEHINGSFDFCVKSLKRHQILVDNYSGEKGCHLRCEILDLSKPIGNSHRFVKKFQPFHNVWCPYDQSKGCYHGVCRNVHESKVADLGPQCYEPTNITDVEIRVCYNPLNKAQWLKNAFFTNNSCTLNCEAVDTSKTIKSGLRNIRQNHPLSNKQCIDSSHSCEKGRCIRLSMGNSFPLNAYTASSVTIRKKKISMCTERMRFCDEEPDTSNWLRPDVSKRELCEQFMHECNDVPGYESERWNDL